MALGLLLGVPHFQESTTPSLAPKTNEAPAQPQPQPQPQQATGEADEGKHPLRRMQKRVLAHERKRKLERAQDKMRKVEAARKKNAAKHGEGEHNNVKAMEKVKNARARRDAAAKAADAEREETRAGSVLRAHAPSEEAELVPRECARFIASGTNDRAANAGDGDAGGSWSVCTHAVVYGLNFDFALAEGLAALAKHAAKQRGAPQTDAFELGSGLGLYADWIARAGHRVLAVEPEPMHTPTYGHSKDRMWPRQLATDLFHGPGTGCAAALPGFDLVYSIEVLEHIPLDRHPTVISVLANVTKGFLVFSAAHPGQGGTGHIAERPRSEWIKEWQARGFKYLVKTTAQFRHATEKHSGPHSQNLMVFAAPGAPLGRAADDGSFGHLPAVDERMYARHEAAHGWAPLFIDGEDVGRWNAPLRQGEVETWPDVIKQLRRRCFKPAEEVSSQESAKAWLDAANANGVSEAKKAANAKTIADIKAAIAAADAKAAEDRAGLEAAVAHSAENDARLTKGVVDEAAKGQQAADGWCATCGPRPAQPAAGESAAEQAGRDAAKAASAAQAAAEAKVRAEAEAASDANAAAAAAEAGAEAKAVPWEKPVSVKPWDPNPRPHLHPHHHPHPHPHPHPTSNANANANPNPNPNPNPSPSPNQVEPWDPSAPDECRGWCATNKERNSREKTCTLPGCSQCSFCPHS